MSLPYVPVGIPVYKTIEHNGANFNTVIWSHQGAFNGKRILFVHGFGERVEVYSQFFDRLTSFGFDVFAFDQRGFGKTGEEWSARGFTNNYHTFDDLEFFITLNLNELAKEDKLCLVGHSMGGGIVLEYASVGKQKDKLYKIACTGPEILLSPEIKPNLLLEWTVRGLAQLPYLKKTKFYPKIKFELVTHDVGYQDYLKADELMAPVGTLVMLRDMVLRGRGLLTEENMTKLRGDLPLLIVQGEEDKLSLAAGAVQYCKEANRVKGNDLRSVILIPGCYHSCLIESPEYYDKAEAAIVNFLSS
ncbi:unnamed protein product [Kuraishia capsulata CBS 1993]|uniref:Serine aminopeptidase S33 domain-containing protein n=1 Tax=Kuraishia capsulata CBS 1993 TaxID=1382522 RepID=W6MLI5_9ASCO|nr:uncharacterized protein KUCA_T00003347001 [Kuraishia capsulata CBS 1993]CDK27369.1 unnamed protein product [Kuraishia capsulata CBS 1993]